jgi:hypothetical protein
MTCNGTPFSTPTGKNRNLKIKKGHLSLNTRISMAKTISKSGHQDGKVDFSGQLLYKRACKSMLPPPQVASNTEDQAAWPPRVMPKRRVFFVSTSYIGVNADQSFLVSWSGTDLRSMDGHDGSGS